MIWNFSIRLFKCLIDCFSDANHYGLIYRDRNQQDLMMIDSIEGLIKNESIIVKKEREASHDQEVMTRLRKARSAFFTQQLPTKLIQAKPTEEERQRLVRLFLEQSQISLDQFGSFAKYGKQIQQLKSSLQLMQKEYQTKRRECLPIQQIINSKIDSLRIIRIEYQPNKYDLSRYSVSAFALFKVVHANRLLDEVCLRGVQVQQFQRFTNLLNRAAHNRPIEQQQLSHLSWIKNFSPSKSLKLSIQAQFEFDIKDKADTRSRISDLAFFRSLFYQLSDITIWAWLGDQKSNSISQLRNTFQELWDCLRSFKKMQIQIQGNLSIIRSTLFGGLNCFTQIAQLSFTDIFFSSQIGINDFLAMEQSLITLFKNNTITHLQLYQCQNFPIFPKINTLQSIHLCSVSFRKQFGFMSEAFRANPFHKSVKCSSMESEWRIEEPLFNQLQTLKVGNCSSISFADFSLQTSNIKNLRISSSSIGRVDCLSVIFPKLAHLSYLQLSHTDVGHVLLCTIPSPHLRELVLFNNSVVTDQDLRVIDSNWPQLNIIFLKECKKITGVFWAICEFKGLIHLKIDRVMLGEGSLALQQLKSRGIKVDYY